MTAMFSRTQIGLGVLCLALLALLAYELSVAPAAADVPAIRWQARDAASPLGLAPPSAGPDSYSAIDARPVFNPSRKPVEVPAAVLAAAPPPPPSDVVLIGIIIDGERRLALLHTPASPLSVSATVGATVDGWQVATIEPDHVILRSGTSEFQLNLNSGRPAATDAGQRNPMTTAPPDPTDSTAP